MPSFVQYQIHILTIALYYNIFPIHPPQNQKPRRQTEKSPAELLFEQLHRGYSRLPMLIL